MSGIYGVVSDKLNTTYDGYMSRLRAWNKAYGIQGIHENNYNMISAGICYDDISTLSSNSFITENERYKAVIDAVIYNRDELIEKYKTNLGLLETESDEEIVFDLLINEGVNSLQFINGDFAGALFDSKENTITFFRDHMGVRPIFLYHKGCDIIFSTDIRGITSQDGLDLSPNEDWVAGIFTGYEHADSESTVYKYVKTISPAGYETYNVVTGILIAKNHYWEVASHKIRLKDEKEYVERLRYLIEDSISRRLITCGGHTGCELSGGLDSSVISIILSRLDKQLMNVCWSADPEIYPIVDPKDERKNIIEICDREHMSCRYINANSIRDPFETAIGKIGEFGIEIGEDIHSLLQPYYYNSDLISGTSQALISEGINVCFTGHGGDEGVSHRCNDYELLYHHEYFRYIKQAWYRTKGQKHHFVKALKRIKHNLCDTRKLLLEPYRPKGDCSILLAPEYSKLWGSRKEYVIKFAYDPKQHILDGLDTNRLMNVAMQGAYNGVRYMVPYLDYRVIDYALSIPRYLYQKGNIDRYIYRETFKDIIPESLYYFKDKDDVSFNTICDNSEDTVKKKIEAIDIDVYINEIRDMLFDISWDVWGTYLNKDKIEQWLSEFSFDESVIEKNLRYEQVLNEVYKFDNFIKLSREYSKNL